MVGKKTFIVVWLVIFALGAFYSAEAQQTKKLHRVGYLTANTSDAELPRLEAFRQALRDLGHIEGQNIVIEYRHAEGKFEQLPGLATELIGLKLDVLVGVTTNAVQAAKQATRTIPIIFIGVSDPIAAELVEILARPGGEPHGIHQHCAGIVWQTIRAAQGNRAQAFPRCGAVGFTVSRICTTMERNRSRSGRIRFAALFYGGEQRR